MKSLVSDLSLQNVIVEQKPPGDIVLFVSQLKSPLIYILLGASAFTYFLRDYIDTVIILAAVGVNTFLGFIQERKAQHGLQALKKILTPTTRIIRNNTTETIDARLIKPSYVVVIGPGDNIPADGILVEEVHLFINEAILTGESMPISKNISKDSLVFAGTAVTSGRGKFRVTKIGMNTKLGTIAQTLQQTKEEETTLQRQLKKLSHLLAIIVSIICIFIFLIGIIRGENYLHMLTIAVALAVAAIPEGMVVSLTVILSLGMERILSRHALVRRLAAAETLGSITTLCVDKTGTLTEGVMKVVQTKLIDHEKAIYAAVLANNLENPIDIALWEWTQGQDHVDPQQITESHPRIHEIPFNGTNKFMCVATDDTVWIKGAPEILLARSTLSQKAKNQWTSTIDEYAKKGLRVIALGFKKRTMHEKLSKDITQLTFVGVIGVSDPIRSGVKEALELTSLAGIDVKVVTGDYRVTSEAVMRQLGIVIHDPTTQIIEGIELTDLSTEELARKISHVKLFCRVSPEHKLKIVEALQKNNEIVAMTGDGVNDALAIKKSDIGIVVSNSSDVARDTSDMVLLDSNFQTIVAAIEEGRVIFQNIKKVVLYLLSDAGTEMLLIVLSIVFNLPLPLTAIQILWINILSDGFPNLALAFEEKESDVMRLPPKARSEPIIDRRIGILIAVISISKALIAFIVYWSVLQKTNNLMYAQTMTFAIVATGSLLYVFSTRSLLKSIAFQNILKNPLLVWAVLLGLVLQFLVIYQPWFVRLFKTYPLAISDWLIVLAVGTLLIGIIEIVKYATGKKRHSLTIFQ